MAEHQAKAKEIAIELLARRAGERLLEVGVGTGWALARVLSNSGAPGAIGLDVAPGMLDVARQRLSELGSKAPGLVLGDGSRLPFRNASFDCLLCTYTLEVLPSDTVAPVLVEFQRVLRPRGRLVVAGLTEGEGDDAAFTDDWKRRYTADPQYFGGSRPLVLAPLLAAAGYELIGRRYSGHGAGWPSEIVLASTPQ